MKLGLIVNPIAGMGGRVGLKGTDGEGILEKAISLGAIQESPGKAIKALEELLPLKDRISIYTYPGEMGENEARQLGFDPIVLGDVSERTLPSDTIDAARWMKEEGVDLIMFAGGDGTARNVFTAIETSVPVIGIPAGVKIHSGVFAMHPRAAGKVALDFLSGLAMDEIEAEVMDIDEEAFREGVVSTRLYGIMRIPLEPELLQVSKTAGAPTSERDTLFGIAERIVEEIEENPDVYYIIGSGTSTRPIMEIMELPNTLLGIDVVKDMKLVGKDVSEREILDIIGDNKAKIVVTVIGSQGYIFGRGNHQISAEVIKKVGKDNIIIVATKHKLDSLDKRPLLVDTGDDEVNAEFTGRMKVRTSYFAERIARVEGL